VNTCAEVTSLPERAGVVRSCQAIVCPKRFLRALDLVPHLGVTWFVLAALAAMASIGMSLNAFASPSPAIEVGGAGGKGGDGVPFSLPAGDHVRYMSPTGRDTNNGTSPATAWATPNHALRCGDVIIAEPGTYSEGGIDVTRSPSSCPSTSGGIDGAGGVYFVTVLCAKAFACMIKSDDRVGSGHGAIQVEANNWAFEGWQVTTHDKNAYCFEPFFGGGDTIFHHVAAINNICSDAGEAFSTGGYGTGGIDYFAVVGNIAYRANQRSDYPSAAITSVAPKNIDDNAGTHILFDGNFGINNTVANSAVSDLECMMFDSWDVHKYTGRGVIKNNICYYTSAITLNIFQQTYGDSALDMDILQNTFYAGFQCAQNFNEGLGEINLQLNGGYPWTINVLNNIAVAARSGVGCQPREPKRPWALLIGGVGGVGRLKVEVGGIGKENVLHDNSLVPSEQQKFWFWHRIHSSCLGTSCDSGLNAVAFNGFSLGNNLYVDPVFRDANDLLSSHLGPTDCSTFANAAACMGWDYQLQKPAKNSVIDDLTPTAAGTSDKGYKPPGPCAPDPLYPAWLKGIVYLQWNGASITEDAGLINKPCGM